MKIVEVITQLTSGGAERFVVDLCNELSKKSDVTLIVIRPIEKYGFYASKISSKVNVLSMNKCDKLEMSIFFNIRKEIRKMAPDVVHLHLGAIIYSLFAILTLRHLKFFYTVHNDADKDAKNRFGSFIRWLCFRLKLVSPITISKKSHQSFVDYYKMDASMIFNGRNIPQNIKVSPDIEKEFEKYHIDTTTRVLVCLARITQVKRQVMFTKIAKKLSHEGYNFTVLFIGSTKDTALVEKIKSYNCPNIHILGEKSNPLEYLKMSDAFCLSSLHEGLPISLIEAIGVGTIPVCTPVGGIVDVIENDVNGLLSNNLSEDSYYDVLKKFLSLSESKLSELKEEASKSYAPFSMTECAYKYFQLFSKEIKNDNKEKI